MRFASTLIILVVSVSSAFAAFNGQATFYDPSIGACGKTNTGTQLVVAVSAAMFDSFPGAGTNPNKNPICNRKVKATLGGKPVTAAVVDRCVGCAQNDIDLSPAAFKKIASLGKGRVNIQWQFA